MRSITSYVNAFQDHRTLPRVEMELVLSGKKIEFSPSCAEVSYICLFIKLLIALLYLGDRHDNISGP